MGFLVSLSETIGFWIGIPIGILLGFFIFIYYEPRDVKDFGPNKSLEDYDSSTLIDLLPKLPLWVMNPDYERVDWLNKFINDMWPYFDKVACGIIISTAEPIFSEYIDKFQIKSINFEHLTLGNLPPKIHGLKVQESNENQLVFDLALRWAGNAVIVLAIKLFSLEINVQLIDIQISAATRVILRPFVPTFPCFANIAVSLMEKPQIDFGLKVMRGDIMAIPGLYQCVQEVISKQVAGLYLWPHTYEIPILDSSIGADKKPVGILHVKVVRAQNLLNTDFLSMSDPYVKLSLSGERLPAKKTSVKMNNLNPEWLEDFKMIVKDPQSQVLQMHLYDWEKFGAHDYLGMQVIPLNVLIPYEKKDFTLSLLNSMDPDDPHNKKPRGQITVATAFIPFLEDSKKFSGIMDYEQNGSSHDASEKISLTGTGLLIVTIIGAEDVEGKNHNNPHAVILFRGDKRKTKVTFTNPASIKYIMVVYLNC
ncbi:synaptotagmin-3-like isoform X1 [Olea europaea subsp. europaea]|uniref:Synaptotagmin-3-like isoform X1 n=1 Tax=Olea europaea subsp. europaea TaxID=158383 RepID=A0A8S0QTH5_OLEEU|nr:synaptotagmin-3-like isoform X1 [Olea europaea subsp. europaea]